MIKTMSIAIGGVAAAAGGAMLGWMLTATPAHVSPTTMMVSGAQIETAGIGDRDTGSPAPAPAADAAKPAPGPIAQANKPAPIPAPAAATPAPKEPLAVVPTIGQGNGLYKLEAGGAQVSLDPKRGQLRFKTPYGDITLNND